MTGSDASSVACPLCGGDSRLRYSGIRDVNQDIASGTFGWLECLCCSSLFIDTLRSNQDLSEYYLGEYSPHKKGCTKLVPGTNPTFDLIRRITGRHFDREDDISVLDIGCGAGNTLYNLSLRFPNATVVGNDIDTGPARTNLPDEDRFKFLECSFESIPDDRQFDIVVSSQLLEHVERPKRLLAKVRSVTSAGSVVLFDTPNVDSLSYHLFSSDWIHLDTPRHRILYSEAGLRRVFSIFDTVDIHEFGSTRAYTASICTKLGHSSSVLDESLPAKFLDRGLRSINEQLGLLPRDDKLMAVVER